MDPELLYQFQFQIRRQCAIARRAHQSLRTRHESHWRQTLELAHAKASARKKVLDTDDDGTLPAWDELDKIPDFPVMDQDAYSADIQGLLVAVANVTKLLAGQLNDGKFTRLSRRAALRATLGVPNDSPLLRPQLVRNSWEHIDDRLEKWVEGVIHPQLHRAHRSVSRGWPATCNGHLWQLGSRS